MFFAPPPKDFGKNVDGVLSKLVKLFWGRLKRIFGVVGATGTGAGSDRSKIDIGEDE